MGSWSIVLSGLEIPLALTETVGRTALMIVIGVMTLFAIWFEFLKVRALYGSGDSAAPEERTNCPSCGTRLPVKAATCEYCGEPIDR